MFASDKIRPRLPPGFALLLEDLSREILRENPRDIYLFAAKYFERKLEERTENNLECFVKRDTYSLSQFLGEDNQDESISEEDNDDTETNDTEINETEGVHSENLDET